MYQEPTTPTKNRKIGYARSTAKALAKEVQILSGDGCSIVFCDTVYETTGLTALRRTVKPGDVVIVTTVSAFGGDLKETLRLIHGFEKRNIRVELDGRCDAQAEIAVLAYRCLVGSSGVRPKGDRVGSRGRGRPAALTTDDIAEVVLLRAEGMTYSTLGKIFGIHPSNVKRTLDRLPGPA